MTREERAREKAREIVQLVKNHTRVDPDGTTAISHAKDLIDEITAALLSLSAEHSDCQCSVKERLSGHRIDCIAAEAQPWPSEEEIIVASNGPTQQAIGFINGVNWLRERLSRPVKESV